MKNNLTGTVEGFHIDGGISKSGGSNNQIWLKVHHFTMFWPILQIIVGHVPSPHPRLRGHCLIPGTFYELRVSPWA